MKPGDMVKLNLKLVSITEKEDGRQFRFESEAGSFDYITMTEAELNKAMTNELS